MSLEELISVNVSKAKSPIEDDLLKKTYFGFKFHALTTVDGFLTDYVITSSNIDYRNTVCNL